MPTTRSGRSNSNAKNNDLSRFTMQSILYSQLIYFTIIFLSEARTSAKIVTISENLSQTTETFYFTQRTTARGSKHIQVHSL